MSVHRCAVCGQTFSSPMEMASHMDAHSSDEWRNAIGADPHSEEVGWNDMFPPERRGSSHIEEGNPATDIGEAAVVAEVGSAIVAEAAVAAGDEQTAEEVVSEVQEHLEVAAEEVAEANEVVAEAAEEVSEDIEQQIEDNAGDAPPEQIAEAAQVQEAVEQVQEATNAEEAVAEAAAAEAEVVADEPPQPTHWSRRPIFGGKKRRG